MSIFYGSIHIWLYIPAISLSGDIEKNPGPRPSSSQNFLVCYWDLNNIVVHSYVKISSIHQFNTVCLSETYLDPSIPLHDVNLEIRGYELVRLDYPSQDKRYNVCIYFRNSFPLKILNIHYLPESVSFESQVGSKIYKSVYQSPSQTSDNFEKNEDNFELTLDTLAESTSHLTVAIGDFNIKSKTWYIKDKITTECARIEVVTSQYGLHQIINEPTHVLENSSSCIDLIFTPQPNLIVE